MIVDNLQYSYNASGLSDQLSAVTEDNTIASTYNKLGDFTDGNRTGTDYDYDANGNVLADGDTVTVIKDLKLKGSSLVIKVGTKVKNIRLVDGDHDIDCKVDGIGAMKLKSEFVKKI